MNLEDRKLSADMLTLDQTKSIKSSELIYSIGDGTNRTDDSEKPTSQPFEYTSKSPLRPSTIFAGE